MNKIKPNYNANDLPKDILRQFYFSAAVFSVALIAVFFGALYLGSRFTWYGNEFLFPLLNIAKQNWLLFFAFCWIIGLIIIFLFYWRKTFAYMDTIVEASKLLVVSNDELIRLPPELKQVEDRMNHIKQDSIRNVRLAKEAEQRKNDLIVYLAHDLKTPLTSVIGYLTLLRDEKQISEELRDKYTDIALEKAERLEELINEFFDITRFNLSQMTLELSRVNLTRMLEQLTYEAKPLLAEKNLQYTLQAEPNIEIKCDVNKMERVFDNLLRNAVNYSYENSTIEIDVSKNQDGINICFRNQGDTIPEDMLDRIFEQFYRIDTSRSSKTGGAGLGLAIAKHIIGLHNGTITASSRDEIIEFKVFLPIKT